MTGAGRVVGRVGPPLAIRALAIGALVAVIGGCLPAPATEQGRRVADLYGVFIVVAAAVAAVVLGLTAFAVLRYRRGDDHTLPVQRHGDLRLEIAWTAVPIAIVAVLFGVSVVALAAIEVADPADDSGAGAIVEVTAFRWGWVGSSRVDLQACKLEYSIVSPK